MANQALINLLDWCKRERENLQCQLDALKAGRFKTHSNDGSGWKDTTQDSRAGLGNLNGAISGVSA